MPACPVCAKPTPPDSQFCPSCGAPLTEGSIAATRTSFRRGAPPPSPSTPFDQGQFLPGTILVDRYRIYGLLGRGGMGEVYRADDLRLGQTVALKFLPRAVEHDQDRRQRFLDEVRIARQISHTNVCRVYDAGDVDGRHFITMEFVDGEDLAALLRRIGHLPKEKAVQIARQLCAGLAAAHEQGILHRDLKPANVMIDGRGRARITDFGLAELAGSSGRVVGAGTPAYMAPEQLEGAPASVKSDVYALGLVLYELFTGKRPFESGDPRTVEPTSPSTQVEGFDPAVERIILRCLRKDPRERPASALSISAALPGGDPLAAALAAGETPSPELVAEAGQVGGLSGAGAWTLASLFVASIVAVVLLSGSTQLLRMVPLPKSTDVLEDRTRSLVAQLVRLEPPVDVITGFGGDQDYLWYVATHDPSLDRWAPLASGQAPAIYFWHRQGPDYLLPINRYWLDPTVIDPPFSLPGMLELIVDPHGRLELFKRVPPVRDDKPEAPVEVDWSAFLRESGIDAGTLRPVAPLWTPSNYADQRAAWEGQRGNEPVRVEAASHDGEPVFFRVIHSWTEPPGTAIPRGTVAKISDLLIFVTFGGVFIGGILLARRNLRLGKGDRKGAIRLAVFILGAMWIAVALMGHFVPSLQMLFRTIASFGAPLVLAALIGLFYLALEPYARRYWPQMIVSWVRLLDGRIRDPLVGRDVAIGVVAGTLGRIVDQVVQIGSAKVGAGAIVFDMIAGPPLDVQLIALRGVRGAFASVIAVLVVCVLISLAVLMFLLLLRIIFRKPWLSIGAFVVLYTASGNPPDLAVGPVLMWNVLVTLITLLVIFRYGFLAFAVMTYFHTLLICFPMTADTSAWYAGRTLVAVAVGAGLVAYGIRVALPKAAVAASAVSTG
jgi:predicted Ser/Thr protein kinase